MKSRYWSRLSVIGLNRVGNVIASGDGGDVPSFSRLGCADHLDRLLENMPEQDMKDLGLVMAILAFLPPPMVHALMWFLSHSDRYPNFLGGALFRLLWMGVKGVVMSLYYSGYCGRGMAQPTRLAGAVDYQVNVIKVVGTF